jgi:hypothetical protein
MTWTEFAVYASIISGIVVAAGVSLSRYFDW